MAYIELELMLQRLSTAQWQFFLLVGVVWAVVLVWLLLRIPKVHSNDRFEKLMEWRLWQNNPGGSVEEWTNALPEQKGAPTPPLTRLEQCAAWTAFAALIGAWLLFEWTRFD